MRRFRKYFVVVIVGISLLSFAACEQSSTPDGTTITPKQGVALVDKLPDEAEGLILEDGYLKVKPGYKFEEQKDGTATVARIAGGNTVGSTSCRCEDDLGSKRPGTCKRIGSGGKAWCDFPSDPKGRCKKNCVKYTRLPDGVTEMRVLKYEQ